MTSDDVLSKIFDENGKLYYMTFAGCAEMEFHPITFNEVLYIYNSETHLYEKDTGSINRWVGNILDDAVYSSLFSSKTPILAIKREIYKRVYDAGVVQGNISPFNKFNGLPVNNGVIIFNKDGSTSLIDYTPEMLFDRKIPTDYDPKADHNPMLKVISEWASGDDVMDLYQIPAQALVQSLPEYEPFKRAYLLVGQGNTGKSSYLTLLTKAFGETNISGVSLQDISGRFNGSRLVGRYLNIKDDLQSVTVDSSETFKEFTGSRKHEVEMKYQHAFFGDIHCVHVFSCNKSPEIGEKLDCDDAFWNRWSVVKFQNVFDVRPGWMRETFTPENLKGFFKLVVEVASVIIRDGNLQHEPNAAEVKDAWKQDSSPILEFIELHTERGASSFTIPKDELLTGFHRWIDDESETEVEKQDLLSRSPRSKRDLTRAMFRAGIDEARLGKKNPVEAYRGIRWKPGCRYAPTRTENSVIT